MSPAQSRWFFVGFTAVFAVAAINAHRQPSRIAQATTTATPPVATPQRPVTPLKTETATPVAKEPIKLAAVSEPVRIPTRLPSATMVGQLPLPSVVDGDVETIRTVQKELVDAGYGPLLVNGNAGPLTRAAVMAFEYDSALGLSGEVSERLLRRLRARAGAARAPDPEQRRIVTQEAEHVTIIVQKSLQAMGGSALQIDGRVGAETEAAIRAFEIDAGLKPTGRISADLFSALARAVARSKAD